MWCAPPQKSFFPLPRRNAHPFIRGISIRDSGDPGNWRKFIAAIVRLFDQVGERHDADGMIPEERNSRADCPYRTFMGMTDNDHGTPRIFPVHNAMHYMDGLFEVTVIIKEYVPPGMGQPYSFRDRQTL